MDWRNWWQPDLKIKFICHEEDYKAIPEPQPANKVIPEWYRKLPQVDMDRYSPMETGITIKRCVPFFDAMAQGYIVFAPADIRIKLSEGGSLCETGTSYPRTLISSHRNYQVKGAPFDKKAILKFETLWSAETPPGYSCLFVQPFNRPSDFAVFSGIIDTDLYHLHITPPFIFTRPDGMFTIEKGTPLVQIIPFKREKWRADIRPPTEAEKLANTRDFRGVHTESGWYRKHTHAKR